jgi:hypothetical protein
MGHILLLYSSCSLQFSFALTLSDLQCTVQKLKFEKEGNVMKLLLVGILLVICLSACGSGGQSAGNYVTSYTGNYSTIYLDKVNVSLSTSDNVNYTGTIHDESDTGLSSFDANITGRFGAEVSSFQLTSSRGDYFSVTPTSFIIDAAPDPSLPPYSRIVIAFTVHSSGTYMRFEHYLTRQQQ